MFGVSGKRKRDMTKSQRRRMNSKQKFIDADEVAQLTKRVEDEAPPKGASAFAMDKKAKKEEAEGKQKKKSTILKLTTHRKFVELPISRRTQRGLKEGGFSHLTLIQRGSIPHALAGRDILAAARTGSGKTIAFLLPVLENLYRAGVNRNTGLAALVISPTRELAVQIWDVLRIIGKYHAFSAGLVIGGHKFEQEQQQIRTVNIIVCTPGRLLHHMDKTYGFEAPYLQMLVLDEADRLLDLGFKATLQGILQNLPPQRQTLLFSATQTKNVKQLARLSLKDPQYAAVHENNEFATPIRLIQTYMTVEAHMKYNMLWTFIRTHLHKKVLVFLSTCKQVQFVHEMFRKARPGVPLRNLHGKMKQDKRLAIYQDFIKRKECVMFATDIAGRGLDFPGVDWVVQMDCPDNVENYVHRVGRTARYRDNGKALLFVTNSERSFIEQLGKKRVPIKYVKSNKDNIQVITSQLSAFLAEDSQLKYLAQKAFISYVRSVHLQGDKNVFDGSTIQLNELATAMGLMQPPKMKSIKGSHNSKKNMSHELLNMAAKKKRAKEAKANGGQPLSKTERMLARENRTVLSKHYQAVMHSDDSDSDAENFMTVTRKDHKLDGAITQEEITWTEADVKSMMRKMERQKKKGQLTTLQEAQLSSISTESTESYAESMATMLSMRDDLDKVRERARVKGLHKAVKRIEKDHEQRKENRNKNKKLKNGQASGMVLTVEDMSSGEDDSDSSEASAFSDLDDEQDTTNNHTAATSSSSSSSKTKTKSSSSSSSSGDDSSSSSDSDSSDNRPRKKRRPNSMKQQ